MEIIIGYLNHGFLYVKKDMKACYCFIIYLNDYNISNIILTKILKNWKQ